MLITERVVLRQWEERDRAPFAIINADPEVMAHYPAPLSRERSDATVDRYSAMIAELGFGMWAVERRADGAFLGFVGLQRVPFEAHFTPGIEIGWRLGRDKWGHGYATEAARACADYAFDTLGVTELLSMARPANTPSLRVMERIGMHHDPADDFDHPPAGTEGSLGYVLYRLANPRPAKAQRRF